MNTRSIDIGRALTFMFEEEEWVTKFLIASGMVLLSVFIIPGLILQGYVIEIIRRVGTSRTPQLPAWEEWGRYLRDGFAAAVAAFVYALPAVFFGCCAVLFAIATSDSSTGDMSGAAFLVVCCLMFLIFVVEIPLFLLYYAGMVRYAERSELSAFFQFGSLWAWVRENVGLYGYSFVVIIVASVAGSFVPILGQAWAYLATGHALGQFLSITRDAGQAPGMEIPYPDEI